MAAPERLTIRSLYLYVVCLVTLVIAIFAAVSLVRGVAELAYPDPGYFGYAVPSDKNGPSEAEQRRQEQLSIDSQRRTAVIGLVSSGTTLLIAGPTYLYHWRRVQSELAHRPPRPVEEGGGPA